MQTRQKNKSKLKNQKGQSLVEYLIIVAIVGIGSIAVTRSVGENISVRMAKIVHGLGGKVQDGAEVQASEVTKNMYKKRDLTNFLSGARGGGKSSGNQQGAPGAEGAEFNETTESEE